MTALDYLVAVAYLVGFVAVIRWCVRYVKQLQQNPLDRMNNAAKLPSGSQRRARPAAKQKSGRKKR